MVKKGSISKEEYKGINAKFVSEEVTVGPLESRRRLVQIIKYILIFCGMIEQVKDGSTENKTTAYKWSLPQEIITVPLMDGEQVPYFCINEKEYFEERRKMQTIEFKKEPPRAQT